jgi:hypothetical protein
MVAHGHEDYRLTMGHQHLGFSEADLSAAAKAAGFASVRYRRLRAATDPQGPGALRRCAPLLNQRGAPLGSTSEPWRASHAAC